MRDRTIQRVIKQQPEREGQDNSEGDNYSNCMNIEGQDNSESDEAIA